MRKFYSDEDPIEVNPNKRERIQQVHKRLHNKTKTGDNIKKIDSSIAPNQREISRITINEVRKYLGDPLPLPYSIKTPTSQPESSTSPSSPIFTNSDKPLYKTKRFKDANDLFKSKPSIRLKESLSRMRGRNGNEMIDQSVQTDQSIESTFDDSILLTNEDQIRNVIKAFHDDTNEQKLETTCTLSKDISPKKQIYLLVLLSIFYLVGICLTVYGLKHFSPKVQ